MLPCPVSSLFLRLRFDSFMLSSVSPHSNTFATSLWLDSTATSHYPLPTPYTPLRTTPVDCKAPTPAPLPSSSALVQRSSDCTAPRIMTTSLCQHASCALLHDGQSEHTPGSCTLPLLRHGGRKSAPYLPTISLLQFRAQASSLPTHRHNVPARPGTPATNYRTYMLLPCPYCPLHVGEEVHMLLQ